MPMGCWRTGRAIALTLLLTTSIAEESIAQQPLQTQSVSEKVIDPLAFLMTFTLETEYSPSVWGSRGEANQVEGEFLVPFEAFSKQNVARLKVLFETSSPDGTHGLSESEMVYLMLFPQSWGTFGAGITTHLTPETSTTLGAISPGPAVGAVAKRGKWKYGFFNQNFLSDTLAQTELQPILGYAFNDKWSAEIGDAQYTYDWKKGRLTSIPLSGQLNYIMLRDKQDIQFFFRAQYNAKNESGSDMWTLNAGVSLIPKQQ
jgi:hypothetical protein